MTFDGSFRRRLGLTCCVLLLANASIVAQDSAKKRIDLSTSKQMLLPVPGGAQRVNSLPMTMVVSPDGRWVVTLNAGYGTRESEYEQSLAVLDVATGAIRDFPDARTVVDAHQTFFS